MLVCIINPKRDKSGKPVGERQYLLTYDEAYNLVGYVPQQPYMLYNAALRRRVTITPPQSLSPGALAWLIGEADI